MTKELQEKIIWQNIHSSKIKRKILEGKIIAIETEKMKEKDINCDIVDFKGIKVLIPAEEMLKGEHSKKILRNMIGAEIKFVIVESDNVTQKAVGSRLKAMERIREINLNKLEAGDKLYGKVVGTWKKYIRLECVGIEFVISAKDLQYGYVEDVSKLYKINEQVRVVIKEISEDKTSMKISVKDLLDDPFKDIRKEFTERGEYLATITGYTDNRYIC